MKKKDFRKHKKLIDLLVNFTNQEIIIFDEIYEKHVNMHENSNSKKYRMSETLCYIIKNNSFNHEKLFEEYFSTKNEKIKIKIKYGQKGVDEYVEKLKKRPKAKVPFSIFDYSFWMRKGYTEEESKNKVKEIQKINAKKRTKQSYDNFFEKIKYSIDYWTKMGYSLEEAEILRLPYLLPMKNDLISYTQKFGIEKGTDKWLKRCIKYKETMIKQLPNKKTGGYVSKESIKFFIPLYKFCRKLGINRNEIYFGINGSKEFFIKDTNLIKNGGKFYDFCIPKINLIVEYHGTFWHPKNVESWNNPWISFQEASELDMYKQKLAEKRDMQYVVVWSDDNLKQKLLEIKELIMEKIL
jgi:hypothetical protein